MYVNATSGYWIGIRFRNESEMFTLVDDLNPVCLYLNQDTNLMTFVVDIYMTIEFVYERRLPAYKLSGSYLFN